MKEITLEALLEAGCHFGHQVTRQNPKARDYIFEARDNIHIIDLAKTKEGLEEAAQFILTIAKRNGNIIVVGTKRQAQPIIDEEIRRAEAAITGNQSNGEAKTPGLFYVIKRWIGGTLTNLSEVEKNFRKLKDITSRLNSEEEKIKYTKKEIGLWEKERQKLESFYSGIMNMKRQPDAVIIMDTHMEHLAVREARQMNIPIVGITDTNSDPTLIDYPIPANDDAVGSIKIILSQLMDAWIEGKTASEKAKATEEKKEKTEEPQEKKIAKSKIEKQEEVAATQVTPEEKTVTGKVQDTTKKSPVKTKKTKKEEKIEK